MCAQRTLKYANALTRQRLAGVSHMFRRPRSPTQAHTYRQRAIAWPALPRRRFPNAERHLCAHSGAGLHMGARLQAAKTIGQTHVSRLKPRTSGSGLVETVEELAMLLRRDAVRFVLVRHEILCFFAHPFNCMIFFVARLVQRSLDPRSLFG